MAVEAGDQDKVPPRNVRALFALGEWQYNLFHRQDGTWRRRWLLWLACAALVVCVYVLFVWSAAIGIPGTLGGNPWLYGTLAFVLAPLGVWMALRRTRAP